MRKNQRAKWSYFTRERDGMSREERFSLGLKTDEKIISEIAPENRGRLSVEKLDDVRERIRKGFSIRDIADYYETIRPVIFHVLEINEPVCLVHVETRPKPKKYTRFRPTLEEKKAIIEAYGNRVSTRDLAAQYGANRQQIRNLLVKGGAKMRDERHDGLVRKPHICRTDADTIAIMYDRGVTNPDTIYETMGGCVSRNQILHVLKQQKKI